MTGDAVELARIILETRGADYPFVGDRHAQLARAVLEQHEALKLAGTSVGGCLPAPLRAPTTPAFRCHAREADC